MNNTMIQWVTDNRRYIDDKTSRLDLLFCQRNISGKDKNYECPFGRSDHVVLEIEIKLDIEDKQII